MMLRENEIRPDHLRKGQEERFAADVRRLLERRGEFVFVPCPACGGREVLHEFTKYELPYVSCRSCRTLYINPRPTPGILEDYYAHSENYAYWNRYIFPASEGARREKIFRPRAVRLLNICRRYGVPRETLVEVGAGFGTFCEEITRLDHFRRLIAVEPTPDLAETCRRKGFEVIQKPVEQVCLGPSAVDAIASFEVIEHLFSPRDFLGACARMLTDGGVLVLSCPNGLGFEVGVLGAASDTVDVEHLNYFNPSSLSELLKSSGFRILEVTTPGELDAELVRKKVLQGECDLSGRPFLRRVLLEEWDRLGEEFQKFLSDNMLSSHMWLVARKS
ncbi:MAG: Methyltransferase type 11 [Deltaproteobacteria bacterium]|nr:Methyltransferase type 11 [Deltaproteobacteria bacterium]